MTPLRAAGEPTAAPFPYDDWSRVLERVVDERGRIDYVNRYRDSESQIPTDYRVRFAKYDSQLNATGLRSRLNEQVRASRAPGSAPDEVARTE